MPENNGETTLNRIRPSAIYILKKRRVLKFDINAMLAFEEQTGRSWLSGINTADFKYREWIILIWTMLLTDDPALTLKKFVKKINGKEVLQIFPFVFKAIEAAVEINNDVQKDDVKPATWLDLWSFARFNLGLSDSGFLSMTLAQFHALCKRYDDKEEWLNYRSAQICAVVANTVPRKSGSASYSIKDFMPHNPESNEMTDDEMFNMVKYINRSLGGTVEEV